MESLGLDVELRNMALESSVVSEDWMTALSVSFFKGKRERTECKSYRGVNLLSVVSM